MGSTIMGKIADLRVVQQTDITSLQKEEKLLKGQNLKKLRNPSI